MIEAVKIVPSLEKEIIQKDSLIIEKDSKISDQQNKIESLERESDICSQVVTVQSGQIEDMSLENSMLEEKVTDTEKKLFFQKRLKWFFAGGGVLAGFIGAVFIF